MLVACAHAGDVSTVEVKKDDLVIGVEVTGELEAVDSTDIKPPPIADMWDFKIAQIASEGDEVKEGDPVVAFDPSASRCATLESMQNEADAAKKKLDKKRDDAALARRDEELKVAAGGGGAAQGVAQDDRRRTISSRRSIRRCVELDEQLAKLALDAGEEQGGAAASASDDAEIQQPRRSARRTSPVASRSCRQNIAKMAVKAPRAGTIVYPTNWRGEKKKVGDSAWRMEAVLQVVGLGKMVGNGAGRRDRYRARRDESAGRRCSSTRCPTCSCSGTVESIAKSRRAEVGGRSEQHRRS